MRGSGAPGSGVGGILLAAGAGRRAGGPKALRRDPDGTSWLGRSVRVLLAGGCVDVTVVLGAAGEQVAAVLDRELTARPDADGAGRVRLVSAPDWAEGLSASLRAGLNALAPSRDAACVHLVDLPDVGPEVVTAVLADAHRLTLARASYAGRPGHPVVVGAHHVAALAAGIHGDEGGRAYLRAHGVRLVECGELATGLDVDGPGGTAAEDAAGA